MSDLSIIRQDLQIATDGREQLIAEHFIAWGDEAVFVTAGIFPGRRARWEDCAFYAVIHRRFGVWTHLYRVVPADPIHGFVVYLERVFDGEAIKQASDWCHATFAGESKIMDAQDVSA